MGNLSRMRTCLRKERSEADGEMRYGCIAYAKIKTKKEGERGEIEDDALQMDRWCCQNALSPGPKPVYWLEESIELKPRYQELWIT